MGKKIIVKLYSGYGGVPKCEVSLGEDNYLIEIEQLEKNLEKEIQKKGFTVTKTNRQKYARLVIN